MTAMNRVFLAGNLTRNPELRKTNSGTAVADLGLAVSEAYTNKAGEQVESTCFADIVVWGRMAETCQQYLAKGSPVLVEGRLELDSWESDRGEKRTRLKVRANRVQFLGQPRNGAGAGGSASVSKNASRTRSTPVEANNAVDF